MRIRDLIVALEAFAKKRGDDFETDLEPIQKGIPPTALVIQADGTIGTITLVDIGSR
jgi:hypothetical protein